jgi:hypothetical protein
MSIEDAIRRAYEATRSHRAVAVRFKLPIHEVMYILGLMSQDLYDAVESEKRVVRRAA